MKGAARLTNSGAINWWRCGQRHIIRLIRPCWPCSILQQHNADIPLGIIRSDTTLPHFTTLCHALPRRWVTHGSWAPWKGHVSWPPQQLLPKWWPASVGTRIRRQKKFDKCVKRSWLFMISIGFMIRSWFVHELNNLTALVRFVPAELASGLNWCLGSGCYGRILLPAAANLQCRCGRRSASLTIPNRIMSGPLTVRFHTIIMDYPSHPRHSETPFLGRSCTEEMLCEALELTRRLPGIYLEIGVFKAWPPIGETHGNTGKPETKQDAPFSKLDADLKRECQTDSD